MGFKQSLESPCPVVTSLHIMFFFKLDLVWCCLVRKSIFISTKLCFHPWQFVCWLVCQHICRENRNERWECVCFLSCCHASLMSVSDLSWCRSRPQRSPSCRRSRVAWCSWRTPSSRSTNRQRTCSVCRRTWTRPCPAWTTSSVTTTWPKTPTGSSERGETLVFYWCRGIDVQNIRRVITLDDSVSGRRADWTSTSLVLQRFRRLLNTFKITTLTAPNSTQWYSINFYHHTIWRCALS